ncbi:MAG: succinyl-CoA synthetase subunit alpha [Candidatus Brockarchaeota archaeon]|nr:succinyl-CoA synthetase subunit alpha [Candidatus Brockarchaeota archaeon]MBO3842103.1 succinyl-CoA synthetase subunit alpha [Candidatus Brockarchaeota archaeon]
MMSEELDYFASFPEELRSLRGKHVALIGKKVVASGDNAIEVYWKAKERFPDKKPVLAYVPREETLVLTKK